MTDAPTTRDPPALLNAPRPRKLVRVATHWSRLVRVVPATDRPDPKLLPLASLAGPPGGYTFGMAKVLFIPVSIGGGLLAGIVSRKIFDQIWGLVDEEEPPDSKHRDIQWGKLLIAAAVQGAIFRAMKEATDHYSRRAFYRTTGSWPGEKEPEPE